MKKLGLLPLTTCTLLLTGWLLPAFGWFSAPPVSRSTSVRAASARDLASEAGVRHRRGLTCHWRSLLLQHH